MTAPQNPRARPQVEAVGQAGGSDATVPPKTAQRPVASTSAVSGACQCQTASAVAADIQRRAELGLAKYGMTVADNPLSRREWLQHAYEEALDMAVYLKRLIEMENAQ